MRKPRKPTRKEQAALEALQCRLDTGKPLSWSNFCKVNFYLYKNELPQIGQRIWFDLLGGVELVGH